MKGFPVARRHKKTKNKRGKTLEEKMLLMDYHVQSLRKQTAERPWWSREDEELRWYSSHGWYHEDDRYNTDETPLPFCKQRRITSTWCAPDDVHPTVQAASSGLQKGQATIKITIGKEANSSPPPLLIFRGKGQISNAEKAAYPTNVFITYQAKAWYDRKVAQFYVQNVWGPWYTSKYGGSGKAVLLTSDSVDASRTRTYERELAMFRTTAHRGPIKDSTDIWQFVDRGPAMILKELVGKEQDAWLWYKKNSVGYPKLPAWRRRVLMATWVSAAWERFKVVYDESVAKVFYRSGLGATLDDTPMDEITVEGDRERSYQPPNWDPDLAQAFLDDNNRFAPPPIIADAESEDEALSADSSGSLSSDDEPEDVEPVSDVDPGGTVSEKSDPEPEVQ
jgi:hypothetical protein